MRIKLVRTQQFLCRIHFVETSIHRSRSNSLSPKKELLKTGISQKSVKSLFANAPKKKPEAPKVEEETKDEDIFDNESEDDVIAVVLDGIE